MRLRCVLVETLVDRGIEVFRDATPQRDVAATWNVDLYVHNLFDEVAVGHVLSSPFGFDLTLGSPPRTIGLALGMKWRV